MRGGFVSASCRVKTLCCVTSVEKAAATPYQEPEGKNIVFIYNIAHVYMYT